MNFLTASLSYAFLGVDKNVGGQAVIEGVMMRSPVKVSTSVRRPSGEIITRTEPYLSLTKRHKLLGIPIIRGIISFFEMLVLGIKTLNYSAEMAVTDVSIDQKIAGPASRKMSVTLAVTVVISLALAIGLFFFLPILFAQLINIHREALMFNLIAGIFRVMIFLAYVMAMSSLKDIQRIFAYHGAEHKSIFAFEADLPLTVENAARFVTLHPRCGTSFIIIVALVLFPLATLFITSFFVSFTFLIFHILTLSKFLFELNIFSIFNGFPSAVIPSIWNNMPFSDLLISFSAVNHVDSGRTLFIAFIRFISSALIMLSLIHI